MATVGNIINANKRANAAIEDKNYKLAEKWLLRIHRAEIKDGVELGTYRFKEI